MLRQLAHTSEVPSPRLHNSNVPPMGHRPRAKVHNQCNNAYGWRNTDSHTRKTDLYWTGMWMGVHHFAHQLLHSSTDVMLLRLPLDFGHSFSDRHSPEISKAFHQTNSEARVDGDSAPCTLSRIRIDSNPTTHPRHGRYYPSFPSLSKSLATSLAPYIHESSVIVMYAPGRQHKSLRGSGCGQCLKTGRLLMAESVWEYEHCTLSVDGEMSWKWSSTLSP